MAPLLLFTGLLALLQTASVVAHPAKPEPHFTKNHINGVCKQFHIPISAEPPSAIYDIPRVDSDIDAIKWAQWTDTWTKVEGPATILKNTTTSETFNIHAQLCIPHKQSKNVLQIATHGVHYDSRYWDPELDRETQSYVEASLKAGYSMLTYDRLGVGLSDKPDAYEVIQAPLEVEIIRSLTLLARNGSLYEFAKTAKPSLKGFNPSPSPSKIIHVGHSFGSVLSSGFLGKYGELSDGAIITGYYSGPLLGSAGMTAFHAFSGSSHPFNRPSGFVAAQKSGIQTIFFAGDSTAFTQAQFDYGDSIKQPAAVGEFASSYNVLRVYGPRFVAPVQYFLPEFDFYICDGDCKGVVDRTTLEATFPNATEIDVYIHPNTGHGMPLHNNATAGHQVQFDFLKRNGL